MGKVTTDDRLNLQKSVSDPARNEKISAGNLEEFSLSAIGLHRNSSG
jgi:hypothetical protein